MNELGYALGFCDRASWANCEVTEKTNKMQQLDVYYQHFLNIQVTFTVLAPHNAAQSNSNLHSARTPQRSTVEQ